MKKTPTLNSTVFTTPCCILFLCTLLPPAVHYFTTLIRQSAGFQWRFWKQDLWSSEAEWVPLFSRRPAMLWEPALAADRSTVPEAMSSIRDFAVSKLLFMVVAMTPVGPVFSHPLQYKPAACWMRPLMLGTIALRESNGTDGSMRVLL